MGCCVGEEGGASVLEEEAVGTPCWVPVGAGGGPGFCVVSEGAALEAVLWGGPPVREEDMTVRERSSEGRKVEGVVRRAPASMTTAVAFMTERS